MNFKRQRIFIQQYIDATAALNIAAEFYDVNAAVIIKHTNPCGVALGKTLKEAWKKRLIVTL